MHSIKFETIKDQKLFYEHLIQQVQVNFCISDVDIISVAMPGIVKDNVCTWLGNLPWRRFDIAKKLNKEYDKPVYVENDANLGALGEARNNPERNLYFTLSTGIGGGVVSDGKILKKYQDFEPGHNRYTYLGEEREWEDFAAASAVNAKYGKRVSEITGREAWVDITERIRLKASSLVYPSRLIRRSS